MSDKADLIAKLQNLSKEIDSVMTDVCESSLYDNGLESLWDLENASYSFETCIVTAIKSLQG